MLNTLVYREVNFAESLLSLRRPIPELLYAVRVHCPAINP